MSYQYRVWTKRGFRNAVRRSIKRGFPQKPKTEMGAVVELVEFIVGNSMKPTNTHRKSFTTKIVSKDTGKKYSARLVIKLEEPKK